MPTSTADGLRVPPGPPLPKALTAPLFFTNRRSTIQLLRRRYGDAFTIDLPVLGRSVIVSSPALVKQMFTAPGDQLAWRDSPLGDMLGPGSLFSLDGPEHLRERRLLLPPFHGARMQSYEAIIAEEAHREIATWPEDRPFPTLESFMRITLNAILRTVFGAEGPHLRRLAGLLPGMVTLASRLTLMTALRRDLGPCSPGGKLLRMRAEYDAIVDEMIDEALADPRLAERADVMALLLGAHYEDGSAMSRSAIADELLTLLAAGHETTATTLAWTVERLRRHPWILERLRREADGGDENALRMATILEVQRTRPVIVATSRTVVSDAFDLGEWRLPRGMRVVASVLMVHTDDRFFERAREFQPDRFVDRRPDTYAWIPFGGGTRRCIGAAFAHMEMDVVLRTLLREVDLETTPVRGERWRSRGIAFAPADGGVAVVRRRGGAPDVPDAAPVGERAAVGAAG